jgi:hypothetical protein
MKPYVANILNALVLIIMGSWGYFGSENPSFTALIPVVGGVLLLATHPWLKKENKMVAHVAVVLTLVLLGGLVKPFVSQLGQGDTMGIIRVGAMILTCIIAMVTFIRSFIEARKNKT